MSRERFSVKSGFASEAGVKRLKNGFAGLEDLNSFAGFIENKLVLV